MRRTRLFVWLGDLRSKSYQWDLPCNGNATQAISLNHVLESRPPNRHSIKNNSCWGRLEKCINALCQHLRVAEGPWESLFWPKFDPFWPHLAVLWVRKASKTARYTHQIQTKMRQNHPKMGFGGILDHMEVISIPSISISKGIKNKKFDRFWVPSAPLIGWQRAPP